MTQALVGTASGAVLTKKQGWIRARGGQVDFYLPGVYTGPMLPAGKAERIARKGLQDCEAHLRDGTLVPLRIPGHYSGRIPPRDGMKLFGRLLKAAEEAKTQHDNDHVLVFTETGITYAR